MQSRPVIPMPIIPMPIIIAGAAGRMGRTLAAQAHGRFKLAGLIEAAGHPALGEMIEGMAISDNADKILAAQEERAGLIDFTRAGAGAYFAEIAMRHNAVYVVGTTALTKSDKKKIAEAAKKIPVIAAENMSLGITLMASFVRRAAEIMSAQDWDIEIREIHHRDKIDAPSGTALLLGRAAGQGRGENLDQAAAHYGPAQKKARARGAIGFSSARGGNIAGTHDVIFAGKDETLTFTHQAVSREVFAVGALRACLWGRAQGAGLFDMHDVLGL